MRLRFIVAGSLFAVLFASEAVLRAEQEPRPLYIEGYTDQVSYVPGEEVAFHVSTSATEFSMRIARVGAQSEPVFREHEIPGTDAPVKENASAEGCDWPVAFRIRIPQEWRSGYYEVTLNVSDRGGRFIRRNRRTAEAKLFFVLRALQPGRDAKILLQLTTNTYNAYNNWGGHSFYSYHDENSLQGHRISFNRPLAGFYRAWEQPFVAWAETNGYALDYAANSDLEFHPEILSPYELVLSVGHDEYWSAPMRDHLEDFIGKGGNVAFFSGNSVCWQIRSEESGRVQVCWKQWYNQDPVYKTADRSLLTSLWSHHLVGRPENQLTGVGFLHGGFHRSHGQFIEGSGALTVHRPDHWIFAETGLKQGDEFGGKETIVGYECDGCEIEMRDGLPVPTHRDGTPKTFVILGTAPARWHPDDSEWYERWEKGRIGAAVMGVYTRGGTVFTAGTTDWSHGLRGNDKSVERITRNVLDRLTSTAQP
jgi:hypothetical protein